MNTLIEAAIERQNIQELKNLLSEQEALFPQDNDQMLFEQAAQMRDKAYLSILLKKVVSYSLEFAYYEIITQIALENTYKKTLFNSVHKFTRGHKSKEFYQNIGLHDLTHIETIIQKIAHNPDPYIDKNHYIFLGLYDLAQTKRYEKNKVICDKIISAIDNYDLAKLQSYVRAGTDLNFKTNFASDQEPLLLACEAGEPEILNYILKTQPSLMNEPRCLNTAPLFIAARSENIAILQSILDTHPNMNANSEGQEIISYYCSCFDSDKKFPLIVDMLIEAGADINAHSPEANSAFVSLLTQDDTLEKLKFLVSRGAKIEENHQHPLDILTRDYAYLPIETHKYVLGLTLEPQIILKSIENLKNNDHFFDPDTKNLKNELLQAYQTRLQDIELYNQLQLELPKNTQTAKKIKI